MKELQFGSGFHRAFAKGKLTLGIGVPLEAYNGPIPTMRDQLERVRQVEKAGFAVLWCRDVPLYDPSFGDVGQIYDPWPWLGYIAAHTTRIALGTASIILPLRSPVDLAKSAASVDQLTAGRLVLGVASGDRPIEYSVYQKDFQSRDNAFREAVEFIKDTTHKPTDWDNFSTIAAGRVDLLPKSHSGDLPLLVTGNSRQSVEWIAEHAAGWLMYPRPLAQQEGVLSQWHKALEKQQLHWKPFAQSLYIDLTDAPDEPATPIHLGYRVGRNGLLQHLEALQSMGVNHVLFNVKFSTRPVDEVIEELREFVIPAFPAHALQSG